MALQKGLVVVIFGAVVAYWVTLPPDRVVFDEQCEPVDFQSGLSAAIYGAHFWRAQQAAALLMANQLATLPAVTERANQDIKAAMSPNEQKMLRLSLKDGAENQDALAAQQRARIEKIAWLGRCRDVIKDRIGP